MSSKTVTAVARFLSPRTRREIDAVTQVDWKNDYAVNIDDRLRRRGEADLAEKMLSEIEENGKYAR